MANTYTLISSQTLSSSAASVTFSSIPSTYNDIKVAWSARQDTGSALATSISLNGSTANFSGIYLYSNGQSPASGSLARYVGSVPGTNYTTNCFSNSEFYIPNYAGSTNKSFSADNVDETNSQGSDMNFISGLWSNTAAITSIVISPASGNFIANSTFYLYGIKNA